MRTFSDIVGAVAEQEGVTKAVAEKVLRGGFDYIAGNLAVGEEVRVNNFGTFSTGARAARQGRNPQTGAVVEIAASTTVKFKAAKSLKEAV